MSKINNINDFVYYVSEKYGKYPDHNIKAESRPISRESLAMFESLNPEIGNDESIKKIKAGIHSGNSIIDRIIKEILDIIPDDIKKQKLNNFGFGHTINFPLNAFCYKSKEYPYTAMIFNTNMITYLWRFQKYTMAQLFPDSVFFCDNIKNPTFDRKYYYNKMVSLSEDYKKKHIDFEKYIIRLKPTHKATLTAIQLVDIAEKFIACHEFGHILNGDLENDNFYSNSSDETADDFFFSPASHKIEFMADIKGFELLINVLSKSISGPRVGIYGIALMGTMFLFDILQILGGGLSYSHPDPIQRIFYITKKYFGNDMLRYVIQTYNIPELAYDKYIDDLFMTPNSG